MTRQNIGKMEKTKWKITENMRKTYEQPVSGKVETCRTTSRKIGSKKSKRSRDDHGMEFEMGPVISTYSKR